MILKTLKDKAFMGIYGKYLTVPISVPNGELYDVYKDKIINASKNKGEAFRYNYSRIPYFESLDAKPSRVNFLFKDENISRKDIMGFE